MKAKTLVALGAMVPLAAMAQSNDMEQLKATMEQMQQTINSLQQQVNELKQEHAAPAVSNDELATNVLRILQPMLTNQVPSQVTPRDTLNDNQEGAQRPDNLTLDPQYHGFIPVPNTPAYIKFNAKVRVDATADNRNSGNPDRFVTATIPVQGQPGYGGGSHANVNARGSSLSVDVRAPNVPGDPRFYYNNDFFGGGVGGGMGYRLKQLYGTYFNVTAGFTYSVFEDPDVWPDTVDFEGPNSMIFARQATVRYLLPLGEHWQMNFGVEAPSSDVDTFNTDATPVNHSPDGGVNVRWENSKIGHVQFATLIRDVGADSVTFGNQSVLGWGLMASAGLNVFKNDSLQLQTTYGDGYFHVINDNFTYAGFNGGDAAYNGSGELQAMQCFSAMAGYTHQWNDQFRSSASLGYVDLQNQASEGPLAYHQTYYVSGNFVYQIRKRLSVGIEALYGKKVDFSGASGDVYRIQVGLTFALFP